MTPKLFSELGLSPNILKAIEKLGFEQASPIQAESIPVLMSGRDVVGQSQTGSGKTVAFAAPAIEKVDVAVRAVQILILCPTRELAVQVSEEVHKLALFTRGIHALPIYGGQSYDRQISGLRQGAQIVIGTPGRVMDHMRRGTLRLDKIKMVILDEVDIMLNMGFRDDMETILKETPAERQTVLFSATIPRAIQDLISKYTRDPQRVAIERKELTVPTVEQSYFEVDRRFKIELLTRLIDIYDLKLGIIFCNTKRMVDDLVDHLNAQGYSADRLHGDMNQQQRDRVMTKFRKSGLEFLVATDIAARGIDVDDVQVVFNYDLPYDVEDYLHRIGRTGRAGKSGRAISFVGGRELFQIQNIERFTKVRIKRAAVPTAGEVEEARANVFMEELRTILKSGEFKKQDHVVERLLEEGFTSTDIASALIHQLQNGAGAPAAKPAAPSREEERPRYDDRPRRDDGPRNFERRDDRPMRRDDRPARPSFAADRPAPPARKPWVAAEPRAARPAAVAAPKPQPAKLAEAAPVEKKPEHVEKKFVPKEAPVAKEPAHSPVPEVEAPDLVKGRPAKRGPFGAPFGSPAPKPKAASRRTPEEQTRIFLNVGAEMGVEKGDIVGAILGETGLPGDTVGVVDLRERHVFVDVAKEHANSIISKLNRTQIKGHKLKVKVA
ncbi:MAG: box helicase [Verrucomicrobiales bacterium]|nr:box helicase [Verrucomicrobiales bacterium]